jgi:hypothetical protein
MERTNVAANEFGSVLTSVQEMMLVVEEPQVVPSLGWVTVIAHADVTSERRAMTEAVCMAVEEIDNWSIRIILDVRKGEARALY